jgi:SAM-dependent methyltransferase
MSESKHEYIRTVNQTGFATTYLDEICKSCLDFSRGKSQPVLEIGCAYGVASLALLKQGNFVIANDTAQGHLDVLEKSAADLKLSDHLEVVCGEFPDGVLLKENSLCSVLSSWVFHFFSPEVLERSAEVLFRALAPGGKAFLTASSPYIKFLSEFTRLYEEEKAAGSRYPGWMGNVKNFLSPQQSENLPPSMHFLDPEVLSKVFGAAGFVIETAKFYYREDCTEGMYLDGRENVGLIALKPI